MTKRTPIKLPMTFRLFSIGKSRQLYITLQPRTEWHFYRAYSYPQGKNFITGGQFWILKYALVHRDGVVLRQRQNEIWQEHLVASYPTTLLRPAFPPCLSLSQE
ncbi:MAG: hypothetical protein H7308_18415 [Chthonomonadaceae bacterium]|nr:hypothetical protein [Chthonomonadaceae bacterium]